MNAQDIILTYSKIYESINIFSSIQLHQLRVAKVAKQIASMVSKDVDVDLLVAGSLLHDMGNIVKIDFNSSLAKEFLRFDEHDADYWNGVKEEHVKEYGDWSHDATSNILKKLEVEKVIVDLIDFASWQHIDEVIKSDDIHAKILAYSDYRVIPSGVSSLDDRLADLKKRYHDQKEFANSEAQRVDRLYHELEEQLVSLGMVPEDISDESIASIDI